MSGRARCARPLALAAMLACLGAPGSGRAADVAPSWEWEPSLFLYVLPEQPSYLQPTIAVNRGALHLEARYDYEALETGSAWIGWNLAFGDEVRLGLTPMLGAVFGRLNGVAAGLVLSLGWGPLSLWSQSEYVVDLADRSGSYFYEWSELGVTGPDWLRVGLVLQRTRAFQTSTEVQGGPMVAISIWRLTAATYLFAPGQDDQFVVVSLAGAF